MADIETSRMHGPATGAEPLSDSIAAHLEHAQGLINRGRLAQALEAYGKAIEINTDSAAIYEARGNLLGKMKAYDLAIADFRRAIELSSSGDPSPHFAMIEILQAKGDFAEAERCCRIALELDAKSARGWEYLGTVLHTIGRFEEASASFRRSLEFQPSGTVSLRLAKILRQADAADMTRLTHLLETPTLPVRERVAAGFALGDLLDQTDRFDEAFAAYATANHLFRELAAGEGYRFDGADLRQIVDELIATFTPDYFSTRSDFGQPSELPVFIVGMPRSGTSLVEQIVASHSKVFGAGELVEIPLIRAKMAETLQKESPRHWHRHWHRHLAKVHLARLAMLGGSAERVTDKLPVNLLNLGLIAAMFPQARIILCDRHPLDTALSCYFQLFDKHNLMFSYDPLDCGCQLIEQQRLTTHWKRVLPLRILSVQYEDLVTDPEPQSRRLIEFLGLEWEPACLKFHNTDRPILTKSAWQVRQPIYHRSVHRWKNYEKNLAPLQTSLTSAGLL